VPKFDGSTSWVVFGLQFETMAEKRLEKFVWAEFAAILHRTFKKLNVYQPCIREMIKLGSASSTYCLVL
jgi:hypothetical protein